MSFANRQIIVIGERQHHRRRPHGYIGEWEIRFKVKKRMTWHAVFMGSGAEKATSSPSRTVRIKP